jgi:organic hydroperoxide reductase OsmC/OhrA
LAQYTARVSWQRAGARFSDSRYSRAHEWAFDGGLTLKASASPQVVPPPLSDPQGVDPEEALVASLSSCHMLWFLHIAAKRGFVVESYSDDAVGQMGKNEEGRVAMTRVTLRPSVAFAGESIPDAATLAQMHEAAHHECYIANTVRTVVTVEPGSALP